MSNIYEMTDIWNDAGTAFTAIEMDVTNTASAAGSWLLNLKVGGTNKFSVNPNGAGYFVGDNVVIGADAGASKRSIYRVGNGLMIEGRYVQLYMDRNLTISPDAGYAVEQRSGTNAQTFNIYNTYTDASNYERGFLKWNSNILEIGTEAAGTGSNRAIRLGVGTARKIEISTIGGWQLYNGSTREGYYNWDALTVRSDSYIGFASSTSVGAGQGDTNLIRVGAGIVGVRANNTTTGGALNLIEQTAPSAPAANQVVIYAEDDGAGKTRLMALFPTGAAQQIAIEP